MVSDCPFLRSRSCRLTDGGEHAGEAEIVHGVEGKEVVKKLFALLLATQESVTLVQLPRKGQTSTGQRCETGLLLSSLLLH